MGSLRSSRLFHQEFHRGLLALAAVVLGDLHAIDSASVVVCLAPGSGRTTGKHEEATLVPFLQERAQILALDDVHGLLLQANGWLRQHMETIKYTARPTTRIHMMVQAVWLDEVVLRVWGCVVESLPLDMVFFYVRLRKKNSLRHGALQPRNGNVHRHMGAGGLVVPDVRRLCLWQGSGESDVNGTDAREEVLRDAPLHAAVFGLPRPLPWALEEAPGRRYKPRFSEQVDR